MADLDFTVNADTSRAQSNLKNLENSLSGLTSAFKVFAGIVSANTLISFSDSVTNLKNRLLLLSDSQAQANTQFNALVGIATAARSDLAATGDLYFRIARSAKDLGISQAEAAQITESLAKAMTSSGLSANEAAGPLLQLGQALQSGVFQGDELRSILEGLPPVAKALADQLGVPVGALKKLGSEGQITSQDFVAAMRRAKDAIEQDFAKTIPTIGQAFTGLRNQISLAFSNFETSTQTGQNFALAIEYMGFQIFKLSTAIDQIIGPLKILIQILATLAAFSIVGRIFAGIGAIFTTLARTIGSVGVGVGGAIERFREFFITAQAAGGGVLGFISTLIFAFAPLGRFIKGVGSLVAAFLAFTGVEKAYDWFKSLGDSSSDSRKELEDYRKKLAELKSGLDTAAGAPAPYFLDPKVMLKTRQELDQIVLNYARQNDELQKRLRFDNELIGLGDRQKAVRQALFDLENNYLSEINRLTDQYREKSQSKVKEDQAALPLIQQAIQRVTEQYQQQIGVVKELTLANFDKAEAERRSLAIAEFGIRSQFDGLNRLRNIQDDIAKLTMTEIEKKYYDIARASEDTARSAIEQENSRRRSLKLAEMTATEEAAYYEAAKSRNADLIKSTGELYTKSREFGTGWTSAFQQYVDEATNAAKVAENIFRKATQGMEDAIVNFAKTGKLEWKNFVLSMAEELLRSQVRQLMAQLFNMQGPAASGGNFFAKLLGIPGFAAGGVIPNNKPVLVGERGPEIITGAAGRTVVPNDQLGQSMYVTYNINAVDAASFKSLVARDPGFIHAVATQGAKLVPARR